MPAALVVLEFAELPGEGELLFIADVLVAENQHRVFVHPCFHCGDVLAAEWLAAIDPRYFSGEGRSQLAKCHAHLSCFLPVAPRPRCASLSCLPRQAVPHDGTQPAGRADPRSSTAVQSHSACRRCADSVDGT